MADVKELQKKLRAINESKLNPKAKSIYKELKDDTDNFKDKDVLEFMDEEVNAFYNQIKTKYPEVLKTSSPKKTPIKKTPPAEKKKSTKGAYAKEISRIMKTEGVTLQEARKIYKKRKEELKKEGKAIKGDLKKLLDQLKKDPRYQGIKGKEALSRSKSSIEKDRKRTALPVGKRISKAGNRYYEYRMNRADIDARTPSNPNPKIRLAKGGHIMSKESDTIPEGLEIYDIEREEKGVVLTGQEFQVFDTETGETYYENSELDIDRTIMDGKGKYDGKIVWYYTYDGDDYRYEQYFLPFAKGGKLKGDKIRQIDWFLRESDSADLRKPIQKIRNKLFNKIRLNDKDIELLESVNIDTYSTEDYKSGYSDYSDYEHDFEREEPLDDSYAKGGKTKRWLKVPKSELEEGDYVKTKWKGKEFEGVILGDVKEEADKSAQLTSGKFVGVPIETKKGKEKQMPYTTRANYQIMKKFNDGGEVTDEEQIIIRQYFEDEPFEYAEGGFIGERVRVNDKDVYGKIVRTYKKNNETLIDVEVEKLGNMNEKVLIIGGGIVRGIKEGEFAFVGNPNYAEGGEPEIDEETEEQMVIRQYFEDEPFPYK